MYFNYPQTQFSRISVYGTNMNELLENGEKVGLTHIMATSEGTSFFNFVNQLYFEDKQYLSMEYKTWIIHIVTRL